MSSIAELKDAADFIRYHYENFDGSGTPLGLIGDQIPLGARVLRVVKAFDLLTQPRNAAHALSQSAAFERLQMGIGAEFDPSVMQAFSDLAKERSDLQEWTVVPVRPELITCETYS